MVAPQPFFRPRGTPFSVLHRIRALVRLGHSVELVTYPFGDTPKLPGLVIHRSGRPLGVRDVGVGPSIAKLLLDGPLFLAAYRVARQGGFGLLHTHEEAGVLGARLSRSLGLPHLYDMHSSLPQQFSNFQRFTWSPAAAIFRRLERYILAGADGVIAICPELHEHVLASGYPGPVALIENTFDFEASPVTEGDVRALRERHGLGDGPVVVYTGTLEAYQGLDLLIAAAGEVGRIVPGVRFLVVGGTRAQGEALRRLAAAHSVQHSLVCVPAVPPEEVPRYQRLADVLVTTRAGGMNTPLKIYQYLRAGKPIVATDVRSHTQVLGPNCAELVPPSPPGVAAGLVRVLTDPAYARGVAEGARRLVEHRYGEEVYLERLEHLLAQISGRLRGPRASVKPAGVA